MSIVYFIAPDGESIIGLDCAKNVSLSQENEVTGYSVMDGTETSDGFRTGNKVLNLSGITTYTKSVSQQQEGIPDPFQLQKLLEEVENSKQRFMVYTAKGGSPLFDNIRECVIQSKRFNAESFRNALQVELTIKEVRVSDAAKTTYLPPKRSPEAGLSTSDPSKSRGGKGAVEKEVQSTILQKMTGVSLYGKEGVLTSGN
ncbi:coil containing protein [Vibrio phage 1.121.O._10N.286.46.C4]|nr:coil containing protein [Vibrio phage 1.121.O._10N.286.46.C4]